MPLWVSCGSLVDFLCPGLSPSGSIFGGNRSSHISRREPLKSQSQVKTYVFDDFCRKYLLEHIFLEKLSDFYDLVRFRGTLGLGGGPVPGLVGLLFSLALWVSLWVLSPCGFLWVLVGSCGSAPVDFNVV